MKRKSGDEKVATYPTVVNSMVFFVKYDDSLKFKFKWMTVEQEQEQVDRFEVVPYNRLINVG